MKRIVIQLVLAVLLTGISTVIPQNSTEHTYELPFGGVVDGDPYKPGEHFVFEGTYKLLGLSFGVANFDFTVQNSPNDDNFSIKSFAKSKGALVKLFGFKFLQRIESTVGKENLRIMKTVKRDEQGKRVRDSRADFDYNEKKVTWVETDPKDPSRPPRRVASSIDDNTQDVITAVYMLRRMRLAVGKKFTIKVSDSGLVYDVPVYITAREKKSSILGKKLWCWRVEPEIFGEGRFIEQSGSFIFWITDDDRRIPIRAKLSTRFGGIEIKLKKMGQVQTDTKETK